MKQHQTSLRTGRGNHGCWGLSDFGRKRPGCGMEVWLHCRDLSDPDSTARTMRKRERVKAPWWWDGSRLHNCPTSSGLNWKVHPLCLSAKQPETEMCSMPKYITPVSPGLGQECKHHFIK